mgnify:CR=1 FL=1
MSFGRLSESITYLNKDQKIFTNGSTEAEIFSKYNFKSDSLSYDINNMVLDSYEQTVLKDKTNSCLSVSFALTCSRRRVSAISELLP